MKKTLVVYYSRTGTTKKVAESIAKLLKSDLDEIIDSKDRSGAWGYLNAGRDAMRRSLTGIKTKKQPSGYDTIVIGTPVWGWTVAPAVRTYLAKNKANFKKVAFFLTMGGSNVAKTFTEMQAACNKKPEATLALRTREVVKGEYTEKVKGFVKAII